MDRIATWLGSLLVLMVLIGGSCGRGPMVEEASNADVNEAESDVSAGDAMSGERAEAIEFVRAAPPTMIDLNSGDVKGTRYRADGTTVYGVYESELSKEVRRLGIAIPQEREWRSLASFGSGGTGGHFDNRYREVLPMARRLLNRLDEVNAADEERRDVLEDFMTSLRAGNPLHAINAGRTMIIEIRE